MTPAIKSITTLPYTLPLKAPLNWGAGHTLTELNHMLILAELTDGAVGIAEGTPRPTVYGETPESVAAVVAREYVPRLQGHPIASADDLQAADSAIAIVRNNNTARGALNIALWSAYAASTGKRLGKLLNSTRKRIRVSYILGTGDRDSVLREVEAVYKAGVRCLKVKVGKDFDRELGLLRDIRAMYGAKISLYADANQTFTDHDIINDLNRLAEYSVVYCEEPLPINKLQLRGNARANSPMPIIADDSAFTPVDLARELAFDTFDILNIKTARTGFSTSKTMMQTVLARGKGVMVGSQASSILGCLHALLFAAQANIDYPTEGTFFLKVDNSETIPIVDGNVELADVERMLKTLQADLLRAHG